MATTIQKYNCQTTGIFSSSGKIKGVLSSLVSPGTFTAIEEHHESATHRKMPPMIKSENSTHMKYYKESATQTKKESVTHMKFVKFL